LFSVLDKYLLCPYTLELLLKIQVIVDTLIQVIVDTLRTNFCVVRELDYMQWF
jgi:hypothetical protein